MRKSRVLTGNPDIRAVFTTQDGTGYARIAMRGLLDGDVLLSMFNAEGGSIEQSIEGFCDSFSRPEKYTNPSYM